MTMANLEEELQEMKSKYEKEFGDGSDENEVENQEPKDGLDGKDSDGLRRLSSMVTFTAQLVTNPSRQKRPRRISISLKKHREMVALLKQQLEEEEEHFSEAQMDENLSNANSEEEMEDPPKQKFSKKQRKKKPNWHRILMTVSMKMGLKKEERLIQKRLKSNEDNAKELENRLQENICITETTDACEDPKSEAQSVPKSKGKKTKDVNKFVKVPAEPQPVLISCAACHSEFPSRNKRFDHLKVMQEHLQQQHL